MAGANRPIVLELGIEFVAEVLLVLFPYGAEQMNLPHSFWLGLACWIIGTVIAVRILWIFPFWSHRLSNLEKGLIALLLVTGFVVTFYRPVVVAYGKRNESKSPSLAGQSNQPAPTLAAPPTTDRAAPPEQNLPAINVHGVKNGDIGHNTIRGKNNAIWVDNSPGAEIHDNTQIGTNNGTVIEKLQTTQLPGVAPLGDPFPNSTDGQVALWAIEEAQKVSKMADDCIAKRSYASGHPNEAPNVDMVRRDFARDVQQCCTIYMAKLHDAMLDRMPSLIDNDRESSYQFDMKANSEYCDAYDRVFAYLNIMGQTLLSRSAAKH
jgi:hypothetical protein